MPNSVQSGNQAMYLLSELYILGKKGNLIAGARLVTKFHRHSSASNQVAWGQIRPSGRWGGPIILWLAQLGKEIEMMAQFGFHRRGLLLSSGSFILSTIQHGFLCALFKCTYYDFLYSLRHYLIMSSDRRYSSVAEARNSTVKYSRVKRSNTPVEPGRSGRPTINDCTKTAQIRMDMEVLPCACTNACMCMTVHVRVLYSCVVFAPVDWLQVLIANVTQLHTEIPSLHALSGKFIGITGSIP